MLTASKWLLIIAGALLILDSIFIFTGKPNPFFGWGILLFGIGSKAFKKQ